MNGERSFKELEELNIRSDYKNALSMYINEVSLDFDEYINQIILFGSLARGEASEESDIDLLIIIKEEDTALRRELIGSTFDILLETGVDISTKVISQKEFELHKNYAFNKNVRSEGVKIV